MTKTELWKVPAGAHFLDAVGESAVVLLHGYGHTVDGDEIRTARVRTDAGAEYVLRGDLQVLAGQVH